MTDPKVIAVLNALLGSEQASLANRLFESTVFVSHLAVTDWNLARRMADAVRRHTAMLADIVFDLGGTPGLRRFDLTSADLHYQALDHVLPRLIADHRNLTEQYRRGLALLAGEPRAAKVVAEILQTHESELKELEKRQAADASPPAKSA